MARLDVSRLVATWLLDRSGVGPSSLVVGSIDLAGIHARDISLFGGAVRVEGLTVSYDPRLLLAGGIGQATIIRPRVVLEMTPDGARLAGTPRGTSGGFSFMERIRIDGIRIVDARITLDGPEPVDATVSTNLAIAGTEMTGSDFSADIGRTVGGIAQSARITAPRLAVSLGNDALRLRVAQAAVQPAGLEWAAEGLDGELAWQDRQLDATITAGRLVSRLTPPLLRPVELTARASMAASRIGFAVHGIATAPAGRGVMRVEAAGQHDRATGKGQSSITIGPVGFKAGGLRPHDIFPAVAGLLPELSGTAGVSGSIAWNETTISPALVLRLADGVFEGKGVRLTAIRGDIAISGLVPPVTRPGQVITATVEAGGLPSSQVRMQFQLLSRPALRVDAITTTFLGGAVSASPFIVDAARAAVDTRLGFRQVDIGEVFRLVGVDGASGSGRLDGAIPLRVTPGAVEIHDGHLAASGPGVIRLDSDALPNQITEAGESMTLVLQALADFHYDVLTVDLDAAAAGDGTVVLKLEGRNPNLLDGRPFHINISFASNFDRLVGIALASMEAAQALLRHTTGSVRR